MERINMNYLRDLIHRVRTGESNRRIAQDMGISRTTVRKYRQWADEQGYLQPDTTLPDDATLAAALGAGHRPPHVVSSVEPYREVVQRLLDQGVEMKAIFHRLQDDYGYLGSYTSVRRYVHKLRPQEPEAVVRVHTAPGEEVQVDFGSVGQLYDPSNGRARRAYVFVATLCYSRHQYAELVFDQKVHHRAEGAVKGVVQHGSKSGAPGLLTCENRLIEARYSLLLLTHGSLLGKAI